MSTEKPEYSYQQKIAMMRILLDIINADGIVDTRETFFYNQLMVEFEMNLEDKNIVNEKNSLIALAQLRKMSAIQREYFAELMSKMIVVDEDININEVTIYDVVKQFCNIETSFSNSIFSKQRNT